MKFFHISDLHIGKTLHAYDLSDSQRDLFDQIICAAKKERPDAILIAGDVYDKSAPSGEAFKLFDAFLRQLSDLEPKIPVFIIAGNHDSTQRLNYASSFMEKEGIFVAAQLPVSEEEHIKKVVLQDAFGKVNFYLLPFTKPADAKNFLLQYETDADIEIKTYEDAVRFFIEREKIDYKQRNVLVAHQYFVSGAEEPERRDSEVRYISVGGIDSVSTECVKAFDYVALGHIHKAQAVGCEWIRYSGTPMKYSVSESEDEKAITVVELAEKGQIHVSYIPFALKPDVRRLKGKLNDLILLGKSNPTDDYVSITLTDEESLIRPKDRLSEFYHNILEVQIENSKTLDLLMKENNDSEDEDMLTLFKEFFFEMNHRPLTDDELMFVQKMIDNLQ